MKKDKQNHFLRKANNVKKQLKKITVNRQSHTIKTLYKLLLFSVNK